MARWPHVKLQGKKLFERNVEDTVEIKDGKH